jgi:hypothetical protein
LGDEESRLFGSERGVLRSVPKCPQYLRPREVKHLHDGANPATRIAHYASRGGEVRNAAHCKREVGAGRVEGVYQPREEGFLDNLVACHHQHVACVAQRLQQVDRHAGGVPRTAGFGLMGVDALSGQVFQHAHDGFRSLTYYHTVRPNATAHVRLDRSCDSRHTRDGKTHFRQVGRLHARAPSRRENHRHYRMGA